MPTRANKQDIWSDRRVHSLTRDGDGWWCYLAYGLHTHQGKGSHLIHEDSLAKVVRELDKVGPKTDTCDCVECLQALERTP